MKEKTFRSIVIDLLKPIGAFPVENSVHDGAPDVCCVSGWIELKVASRPKRLASRVSIDLRPSQRIWLREWGRRGGRAWTLTLLGDTWLLHDGLWASAHLGNVDELELQENAIATWIDRPKSHELIHALTQLTPKIN